MATTEQIIIQLKDEFTATMNKVNSSLAKTQTEGTKAGEVFKGMFGLETLNKGVEIAKRVVEFSMEALQNWNKQKDVIKTFTRDDIMAEKQLKELREEGGGIMPIEEMTAAWQRLKLRGIDPTSKQMKAFADIAKSQNKSVASLGDSVSHALMGHYRGLMEFGIQTKKVGDQLQMSFMGHTQMIKDSKEAMMDYLTSVGQMPGVKGAVENTNPLQRAQGKFKESGEAAGKAIAETLAPAFTDFLDNMTHILEKIPKILGDTVSAKEQQRNDRLAMLFAAYNKKGTSDIFQNNVVKQIESLMPESFKGINMNDKEAVSAKMKILSKQQNYQNKLEGYQDEATDLQFEANKEQEHINQLWKDETKGLENSQAIINAAGGKDKAKGYIDDQIIKYGFQAVKSLNELAHPGSVHDIFNSRNEVIGTSLNGIVDQSQQEMKHLDKTLIKLAVATSNEDLYKEFTNSIDKVFSPKKPGTNDVDQETAADELSSITSGAPKIFNINIQELIHEQIIQANTLTESKEQIKKIAIEALTDGLNNVQAIAQK
jgi:dsDNA-binding SOS-regulon protein